MNDKTKLDIVVLPTTAGLVKASVIAIISAALILVTTVLPAEYGVDPTGIGKHLGLVSLSVSNPVEPADAPVAPAAPQSPISEFDAAWRSDAPYRNDEITLTLKPGEGTEVKASMLQGQRLVFNWISEGGKVNFDMHGEKLNAAADEYTSYWKGRQASSGYGAFTAPFDGTHGWYWRNRDQQQVTIKVQTAGFYEKLFQK